MPLVTNDETWKKTFASPSKGPAGNGKQKIEHKKGSCKAFYVIRKRKNLLKTMQLIIWKLIWLCSLGFR